MPRVFLGLGANQGDSAGNIHRALKLVQKVARLKATSFLYKTKPMYLKEQPDFFNAACEIETDLGPEPLLGILKDIERAIGRTHGARNGPRPVDIDILTYGDSVCNVDDGHLIVPHPKIGERRFVLQPCCDIDPNARVASLGATFGQLLDRIRKDEHFPTVMRASFNRTVGWGTGPLSMGILNATPDSFSDGGTLSSERIVEDRVKKFADAGCDILDIGGQSTRPQAVVISAAEELQRVLPVIRAARTLCPDVLLSVDTFRADVARSAVEEGAHIINDISAGTFDGRMNSTAAELGTPLVLMHRRGDSQTMDSEADYSMYSNGVVEGVIRELQERIDAAMRAGVPRWQIIADPGLGFAKTNAQSADLLINVGQLQEKLGAFPVLLGPSRKRFVGALMGRPESEAIERDWGSAAAVSLGVWSGGDIMRFHEPGLCDAVRVAHALKNSVSQTTS